MQAILNDVFDPVLLSLEENQFLLEHLGKPPKVVQRLPLPAGVNPRAVMPVIEEVYGLMEVEKHDKEPWTGVDELKARCQLYLEQRASWAEMKRRAGPKFPTFPTMAGWDGRGQPHMGAVGSDAGYVRSYFDEDGQRQPFAIPLHDTGLQGFTPPWVKADKEYEALVVDEEKGTLTCPICESRETWDVNSQSAKNAAHARMAKHLTGAKKEHDAHKALHTKVFG